MPYDSRIILKAAIRGDLEALKSNKNFLSRIFDEYGATVAHYASRAGQLDCLKWLHQDLKFDFKRKSKIGATAAHDAAASGQLQCLKWLLSQEPDWRSISDHNGYACTHLAARFNNLEVLKYLVEDASCPYAIVTAAGVTPLHLASLHGAFDCVEFLTKDMPSCAKWRTTDGITPVHLAAYGGNLQCLQHLVNITNDAHTIRSNDGLTPAHFAAQNDHLSCLQWLYEFDPESFLMYENDNYGANFLNYAASRGSQEMVEYLIAIGITCKPDKFGSTPIHDAAHNGNSKCLQLLLKHFIDTIGHCDMDGLTASEVAEKNQHFDCCNMLTRSAMAQFQNGLNKDVKSPRRFSRDKKISPRRDKIGTRTSSSGYGRKYSDETQLTSGKSSERTNSNFISTSSSTENFHLDLQLKDSDDDLFDISSDQNSVTEREGNQMGRKDTSNSADYNNLPEENKKDVRKTTRGSSGADKYSSVNEIEKKLPVISINSDNDGLNGTLSISTVTQAPNAEVENKTAEESSRKSQETAKDTAEIVVEVSMDEIAEKDEFGNPVPQFLRELRLKKLKAKRIEEAKEREKAPPPNPEDEYITEEDRANWSSMPKWRQLIMARKKMKKMQEEEEKIKPKNGTMVQESEPERPDDNADLSVSLKKNIFEQAV